MIVGQSGFVDDSRDMQRIALRTRGAVRRPEGAMPARGKGLEGRNVNTHTDLFTSSVRLYGLLTNHISCRGAAMKTLTPIVTDEPIAVPRGPLPDLLISTMHAALGIFLRLRSGRSRVWALALREVTVGRIAT